MLLVLVFYVAPSSVAHSRSLGSCVSRLTRRGGQFADYDDSVRLEA